MKKQTVLNSLDSKEISEKIKRLKRKSLYKIEGAVGSDSILYGALYQLTHFHLESLRFKVLSFNPNASEQDIRYATFLLQNKGLTLNGPPLKLVKKSLSKEESKARNEYNLRALAQRKFYFSLKYEVLKFSKEVVIKEVPYEDAPWYISGSSRRTHLKDVLTEGRSNG